MIHFRDLLARIDAAGELLRVKRQVDRNYELGALLKQAERRRKAILFEVVEDSAIPVVGGLLTTAKRMALGLNRADAESFTRREHAGLIRAAIANPLTSVEVSSGPCQEVILRGDEVDCGELPVPKFFADDSGPFLTAAVGISRNPANGVLNVGIYRVLMLERNQIAVSASPSSNLFQFMKEAAARAASLPIALVIGADPAVLMAAAAKAPGDVSELDVAGALNGDPLELVSAIHSDLRVPAHAEIVIEATISCTRQIMNTMGEFGDFYGDQTAPIATVDAITRRNDAIFHTIMAGAGSEHNSIGFIILYDIEKELFEQLESRYPQIDSLRVHFEPPRIGVLGDIYIRLTEQADCDVSQLITDAFAERCGMMDLARVIRRIVVVDHDIDIESRTEIDWAISTRANLAEQIELFSDFPPSGGKVRIGINACANADEQQQLRRLTIPGADHINLDDYLPGSD